MFAVVVVSERGSPAEAATLEQLDAPGAEVHIARGWPAHPGGVPGRGDAAAANAALARVESEVVVFVRAGDLPRPGAVRGLAAALAADAGLDAVVGAVEGDPLDNVWVGPPPPVGLPLPVRLLAVRTGPMRERDGFDDRLRELDVAALELLGGLGPRVALRRDLTALATQPVDPVAVGRAAQALGLLQGAPPAESAKLAALRWTRALRPSPRSAFATGRGLPVLPLRDADRLGIPATGGGERPAVAVICPFAGSASDAERTVAALAAIRRGADDEVLLVDNTPQPVASAAGGVEVVRAAGQASSYFARNAGAAASRAPWMLFVDADCSPHPGILDAFFAPSPDERAGAVAGSVLDAPGPPTIVGGWSEAVGVLSQAGNLAHPWRPFAVTANLLVRRTAFDAVGGFADSIRSGGDADLSWRLQEAGWTLDFRARAAVEHRHRDTLLELLRQYRRYGAGIAWVVTRHPAAGEAWLRPSVRPVKLAAVDLLAARFTAAATRMVSLLTALTAARADAEDNAVRARRQ